jgi:hypothetical protein
MSYLTGELQKLEKSNDHDNPVFTTLLNFVLIFLVIGVVILLMYANSEKITVISLFYNNRPKI